MKKIYFLKLFFLLSSCGFLFPNKAFSQIVISGYMANPPSTDGNFEYLQLVATQNINFATNNYCVVWANNGTATANGWIAGGAISYGFNLTSGTVTAGQTFYVGGSAKLINGAASTDISSETWIRTISVATVGGDGFGTANSGGVFGNGGSNADGIGIFSGLTSALTASTIPIDAIFFGTAVGTANPATGGYVLPTNDIYNNSQGTFGDGTNTTLFPDPASGNFVKITGNYNTTTNSWASTRSGALVASPTTLSAIATGISLVTNPTVNLSVSTNAGIETDATVINVTATASSAVTGNQTVSLGVTGTGIDGTDYTLSNTLITILSGQTTGTVTFTVANDGVTEGTETAILTISSPSSGIMLGSTLSQNIIITDMAPNILPTIVLDGATTSNYIDGGAVSPISPYAISGVLSDPTDPAQTLGIDFTIGDVETALASLVVSVISSNQSVVPNANLNLTGSGASRNLKITPIAVGYASITISVNDGTSTTSYIINYAASGASINISTTRFHTGASDASTAQMIDSDLMLVADDENQLLRLFNRQNSGLAINAFDFTSSLNLTDLSGGNPREVDIEASTKVGNRIYWMASHSNSSGGGIRPNRYRFFATDISGTGNSTSLSYIGRYDNLRTDLLAWDAANGHGLGANYLGLTASATSGIAPEIATGSGFNIEGFEVSPTNTTAYICFRAPLMTTSTRTKALIIPLTNFADLVSGNPTSTTATFGTPIELDLGGRAIREIKKNANGEYLIVAGPHDAATGTAPKDFRFYTWSGNANDLPVLRAANLTALNSNGSFESIVDVPNPLLPTSQIQVLVDNGDEVFYNDGIIAKDLPQNNHKKFRSEKIDLGEAIYPNVEITATDNSASETPTNTANFRLTRTGSLVSDLTVNFTVNGTSTNGTDFPNINTSIIIPATQSFIDLSITPTDDNIVENSETIILTLTDGTIYDLGTNTNATATIQDNDFSVGAISGGPFCAGTTISVPFIVSSDLNTGNIFTAQLSDATGSFVSPTNIGTLTSISSGTISAIIPENTLNGTAYRIRVISNNPVFSSPDNGIDLTINEKATASILGANNLTCNITSVSRTASGGDAYVWSNGLGNNALATINAPGIYTVTVSAANGCTATATTEVTSNTTPPMASILGANNLTCNITSVSRTASGGDAYVWSNGLGNNALATINAPGIYTVTVSAANGCTATATTEVTSNTTPPTASILGANNLTCNITSVSRTASGGDSYVWSNGLGNNALATINAPGIYTVTVSAANGCTATATTEVTSNTTPPTASILGTNNLTCNITSVSRTASGGDSYVWSNGLGNNALATINTAGIYTVTVSAANGCTATATTEVKLEPLPNSPTVSSTTIGSGNPAILNTSGCFGTVRWYASATGTTILVTGNQFTSPPLTNNTTYFADCLSASNCVSTTRGSGNITISSTPCPSNQILTITENSPTSTKYEASEKVISTSKIMASTTIIYDAGKAVELNAGFEAKLGAVFKIQIDGCGNN